MATRLYGVANTASGISFTPDAGWASTTGWVSRKLSTSKAAATETRAGVAVTSGAGNETLGFQLISEPLGGAQNISGTVTIVTRGLELAANDNIGARVRCIKVITSAGALRGTLLALGNHSVTTEIGTSLSGLPAASATALSAVSAQDGDRIVVELGYGMTTTGTSPQYDMVIGGNGTDHTTTNGDTTGTVPWVEFSQNLVFKSVIDLVPARIDVRAVPVVIPYTGEYTIFTTETPDSSSGAGGLTRNLGTSFQSSQDGTVVRGRWYVGSTATNTATTALWQLWRVSDSTKLAEVDVKALNISTTNDWIEFDVPDTAIVAGTTYLVSRFTDDNYPFDYLNTGVLPVTNGPLTGDQALFRNGGTSSDIPNNLDTSMFFADVVVAYGEVAASVTLVPARMNLRSVAVTPVPQPVSISLVPARVNVRAQTMTPVPGPVSLALAPARMALRAVPLQIPVNVTLVPARIQVRVIPVTPVPQPVSVALAPARMALQPRVLTPVPGVVSTNLVPARVQVRAGMLLAVPRPVAVVLAPARLTLRAGTLSAQPGPVAVPLAPARVTIRAVALTFPAAGVVQLVPAVLWLRAVAIGVPPAEPIPLLPGGLKVDVASEPLNGREPARVNFDAGSSALTVDVKPRAL